MRHGGSSWLQARRQQRWFQVPIIPTIEISTLQCARRADLHSNRAILQPCQPRWAQQILQDYEQYSTYPKTTRSKCIDEPLSTRTQYVPRSLAANHDVRIFAQLGAPKPWSIPEKHSGNSWWIDETVYHSSPKVSKKGVKLYSGQKWCWPTIELVLLHENDTFHTNPVATRPPPSMIAGDNMSPTTPLTNLLQP